MSKIAATLLVRDEEDIIAANIQHHLEQGVDYFIATDNGSADSTLDILKSFPQVKLIIQEPSLNYQQFAWVRRMANVVYEMGADWVIHLDADEFWYGLNNLNQIEDNFLVVNSGDSLFPWDCSGKTCRDFVQIRDQKYQEHFCKSDYRYFKYSDYKPMKGCKIAHRPIKDIQIDQGNHRANLPKEQITYCPSLTIDHYPVRSYEHFHRKVVNGGKAYLESNLPEHIGIHWRKWYQAYLWGSLRIEYNKLSYVTDEVNAIIQNGHLHTTEAL